MSRASTLMLLGILVILAPFSGLPMAMRSTLELVFGACVVGMGLSLRVREIRNAKPVAVDATTTLDTPSEAASQKPQGVSPI